eukprot:4371124-Amphidinium_carterae.2
MYGDERASSEEIQLPSANSGGSGMTAKEHDAGSRHKLQCHVASPLARKVQQAIAGFGGIFAAFMLLKTKGTVA